MTINIIGGGIIGLFSAWHLSKEGHEVHVFDKGDLSNGCSYGNAGIITPSHFIPLAAPGVVAQGIRWMFRSDSPFYIRPRFDMGLFNWLWKFYHSCNAEQALGAMPVLLKINMLGKECYRTFYRETGLDFHLKETGVLMLYLTPKKEKEEKETAELAALLGIETTLLDRQGVQEFEKGAQVESQGGVFYPCDAFIYPNVLMEQLKNLLLQTGVQLHRNHAVTGLEKKGNRITAVCCGKEQYTADATVLAAGSWSAKLLKKIGVRLLLQDGKGYSVTLRQPGERPSHATLLSEAKVAITPLGSDLRIGGTLELSGLDPKINRKRVQGMLDAIPAYYPRIRIPAPEKTDVWYGYRPCTPDGLPYIGRIKGFDNFILATGHAMMGVSLAPATGKLVRSFILDEALDDDYVKFFDPNRFAG